MQATAFADERRFPDEWCVNCCRQFGDVRFTWRAPSWVESPIQLNVDELNGHRFFRTLFEITLHYGKYSLVIPAGFVFDGASIPSIFWCVPGFSPLAVHIWAALPHDFVCEHPQVLPRIIGDAIFGHVLEQIRLERKRHIKAETTKQKIIKWAKNAAMYLAVRAWSTYKTLPGVTS